MKTAPDPKQTNLPPLAALAAAMALAALLALLPAQKAQAQAQAQETEHITIGTGGVSGLYYPVGVAICNLVNKGSSAKGHGTRCTAQTPGGSVFNVNALRSGDLSIGIVQSDVQSFAYNGAEQFAAAGPDKSLRVLFSLQAEVFTVVARDDSNIKAFDDLAGKRMNIGDPGSGNRNTLELLMREYGWTDRIFSLAAELKPAEMAGALCGNRIDAFVYVVGHPNGSIMDASNTCSSHLVPVEGPEVQAFIAKHPYNTVVSIPGGLYKGTPDETRSFGPKATLMTNSDLSDDTAYLVTKAVFSNFDEFKGQHPALASLKPEDLLEGNSIPFHPGAVRYFKEAGLWTGDAAEAADLLELSAPADEMEAEAEEDEMEEEM
jgi:TRAP transporter TAXI family solute receptor